ncbi:MAG: hypothetical protein MN733_37400 [Nitrososphaera sp.]|nr:hypothetical protein [Nitrososphaera sp.]
MLPPVPKLIRLKGTVTASVVLLPLSQAAVQYALPKGLALGPQKLTPAGTHPVLFSFIEEIRVRLAFPPLNLPTLQNYRGVVLQIPYVHKKGDSRFYLYPVRLYLNRLAPTLAGWLGYSLAQRFVKIEASPTHYDIKGLRNAHLLSAQFEPIGEQGASSAFPNFQRGIAQLLTQPLLIKYPPLKKGPGVFFCASLHYHVDEPQDNSSKLFKPAQLQAMSVKVQLFRQFAQEFFPDSAGDYATTNLNQSPLGAFRLWAGWSLGPCSKQAR